MLAVRSKLSAAPVDRALALFQSGEDQTTVYVLGDDGNLRLLDAVQLRAPSDAFGNQKMVLDSTSLARDGKQAAFAQLRGYNENVLWQHGEAGVIVEQADKTVLLDLRTGLARKPYASFDSVASASAGDIVRLGSSDGKRSELSRWTSRGVLISSTGLPDPLLATNAWYGVGWRNGALVARSLFAPLNLEPSAAGEAPVVVDISSGKVVRALLFRWDPGSGPARRLQCCEVRGWLDRDTVIVQSSDRLLGWDVRNGALQLIAELPPGTAGFSLAQLARR